VFVSPQDIESFIREFEARSLPKSRWTHQAHLVVGLWYLSHHSPAEALSIVCQRIRAYNETVGTANTDTSGYHETMTRLFLHGIAAHISAQQWRAQHDGGNHAAILEARNPDDQGARR
jgi:hypothetical protein